MGMKIDHVPMSALSSGSTNGSGSSPLPGGMPGNAQNIADYLAQLLKDKNKLVGLPNFFTHVERLLDEGEFRLFYQDKSYNYYFHFVKMFPSEEA